MNVVYRFRIYPNKSQRELFSRTFGCVRFVYNKMLAEKIEHYEKTGKWISKVQVQKETDQKLYDKLCQWKHCIERRKTETSKGRMGPDQAA